MTMRWQNPAVTDIYTNWESYIQSNFASVARFLDGVTLNGTTPVGAKRYNSTAQLFESWSGSAWTEMPLAYVRTTTYTAADVLTKLLTVDGSGSGLDADLLDGQDGSFYRNAGNINAGTLADARLSTNVALRNAANTFTIGQEVASAAEPLWQTRDTGNTSAGTLRHLDSNGYVASISFYSSAHATKSGWATYNTNTRHSFSLGGSERMYITFAGSGTVLAVNGRAFTTPISVSFSATPTFNSAEANTIYFGTMTGNVTSVTISNPVDGAQLQIRFVQDGTGGRTVTLPGSVQVSGSLNTAANAVTWLVLTYVSSASRWEGTWTRVS